MLRMGSLLIIVLAGSFQAIGVPQDLVIKGADSLVTIGSLRVMTVLELMAGSAIASG